MLTAIAIVILRIGLFLGYSNSRLKWAKHCFQNLLSSYTYDNLLNMEGVFDMFGNFVFISVLLTSIAVSLFFPMHCSSRSLSSSLPLSISLPACLPVLIAVIFCICDQFNIIIFVDEISLCTKMCESQKNRHQKNSRNRSRRS